MTEIDRPAPVRPGEELDVEALASYLAERRPDLVGAIEVEQFPSGFSNLTYSVRIERPEEEPLELVLRRPPFGSRVATAHDMEREYHILAALAGRFATAPRPLLLCTDPEVLGAPFYLMERLTGVVLRGRIPSAAAPDAPTMRGVAGAFVDTLVELHGLDFEAAGLGDLGKPKGYVERQIDGWSRRWEAARTDEVPEMERAARWLADSMPAESGAALVHNDFKYDNLVLDPGDLTRVVGVLDWEMATLGDPLMDLGTSLGYWVDPVDPPALRALALSPTTLPGNPSRLELAELYAERSGRDLDDLVFYYVYGLFKIAVIIQQIYYRYDQGLTRDERFAGLLQGVRGLAAMAERAVETGRVDRLFDPA
ncbi:MAG: phosphotransferase family protein [Thermoanaerobaculia bacterium]|nr:phosphotransferase family protein [Thermoanaerobaculia bacterium]